MPTFHDSRADAAEASAALRGLAHASRSFDDPAQTYAVLGDLSAAVRSLRQVIDQVADAHLTHRDNATNDDGERSAGAQSAMAAADELHQAATLIDQADDRLGAAFSHSGQIAWTESPERAALRDRIAARLNGEPTTTTAQAGSLTLTVWPDVPLGEHQRYGYRITDTTTGQELEGRDLFTGAGTPVEPTRALQELAGYLGAAGEARQYALDHHGSSPENQGQFPAWVADAAMTNADDLTLLTEPPEQGPEPDSGSERRWFSVAFLQGEEADEVLDLIDRDGTDAAIAHLSQWDYGEETMRAALENGHVYDHQPPAGAADRTVTDDRYALTYSHAHGHVGLYRELNTPPLPDQNAAAEAARSAPSARRDELGAERDWFATDAAASPASSGRGLSL